VRCWRCVLFVVVVVLLMPMLVSAAETSPRPKNVLLICVDDLRPELACYGASYIQSPNIDALAAEGTTFLRHYVQAPTCGASRYAMLTGRYGPAGNGALFERAKRVLQVAGDKAAGDKSAENVPASMPAWFRSRGYTTVSVGKVSHHPGGRGGPDWNDPAQPEMPLSWDRHLLPAGAWQHPRGWMHGLANGEIRDAAGEMDVFQSFEGDDTAYPDGESVNEALRQLEQLSRDADHPFFLAVGILRPHLPFGAPARYMEPYRDADLPAIPHPQKPSGKTTWHGSEEFMKYNRWKRDPNLDPDFATDVRKHYAACVTFADAQVGRLMQRLKDVGADEETVVLLWGDHGWHLGEHAIWGKHALFEESLRSPLLVRAAGVPPQPGGRVSAVVESIDIFPTLCQLAGIPQPEDQQGVSLVPLLNNPAEQGHSAIAYTGKASTIRTASHRLILHNDGFAELYDHRTVAGETKNIAADHPQLVADLTLELRSRLSSPRR
jgi:iduronate 2-sulfatase